LGAQAILPVCFGQSVLWLKRIEAVKGAASALYGSDAAGGVTNEISRDPSAPVETSLFSRIQGERKLFQGGAEWAPNAYGIINRLQNDKGNYTDFGSVWAQDRASLANRAAVTSGLRFDNRSIFGSAVSPKAGLNFRVTDYWRIRSSYGRGFRAPDLGQLFYRFLSPTNFYQVTRSL
jgi:outer membrane receptor for ferrienterochelin and colicin